MFHFIIRNVCFLQDKRAHFFIKVCGYQCFMKLTYPLQMPQTTNKFANFVTDKGDLESTLTDPDVVA